MGRQKSQIKVSFHPWEIGRKIISIYLPIKKISNWITEMKIKKFANRAS